MAQLSDELIELNGLRFHFRDWHGPADADGTVVLLHGLSGHARTWDALADDLASRYRVLALDQRGHGESSWAAPDSYGTADMVSDLEAFVHALKLTDFALLGLSMGGRVAMQYAGEQPAELARVVIVDIGPELEAAGMSKIQQGMAQTDVFATIEDAFHQARAANSRPPEAHHFERVRHGLMMNADGQWTYRYDRAFRQSGVVRAHQSASEAWASVAQIKVPTLVVRGAESDLFSAATAERMCATMPQGEFVEVANAGHSVPLDNPRDFATAVEGFLARTDRSPS